jgi:hypothetical protein
MPLASLAGRSRRGLSAAVLGAASVMCLSAAAREATVPAAALQESLARDVQPLLARYCHECHAGDAVEGDVNLAAAASLDDLRRSLATWQRVREVVLDRQMPPIEAAQPTDAERAAIEGWLRSFLRAEAAAHAGDPGAVVLRRLDNAEYTYTIRDLTGIASLDPAREFPTDGAAGEGFSNTGAALVMSPALVTKYLDAAKGIAAHAVLLPDGLRFSASTSRGDWTDEQLSRLKAFYRRFTAPFEDGIQKTEQGIKMDVGRDGALPVDRYLAATFSERDALARGEVAAVAREHDLSEKYLATVWRTVSASDPSDSVLVDRVRQAWQAASPADNAAGKAIVAGQIAPWQKALWKFNPVGTITRELGRKDGPAAWMEAVNPLVPRQEFRVKLAVPEGGETATIRLTATDAGDGADADFVVWENPRLVAAAAPDLHLRDVRAQAAVMPTAKTALITSLRGCLAALDEAEAARAAGAAAPSLATLAEKHAVDRDALEVWSGLLGPTAPEPPAGFLLTNTAERVGGFESIAGWTGEKDLSVFANTADVPLKFPAEIPARGVVVHPGERRLVIAWKSLRAQAVSVKGSISESLVGCGDAVDWSLEVVRGTTREKIASGGHEVKKIGPVEEVVLRRDDRLCLVIDPRTGHNCDSMAIELVVRSGDQEWRLADLASSEPGQGILAANPHADAFGNEAVWELGSEPTGGGSGWEIPAGSLLARWQAATSADRGPLVDEIERLVRGGTADLPEKSPDRKLVDELLAVSGPVLSRLIAAKAAAALPQAAADVSHGIDPAAFGRHPVAAGAVAAADLCVRAPASVKVEIPAELAAGREFVVAATVHPASHADAAVQAHVLEDDAAEPGVLSASAPVIAAEAGSAWSRFTAAFDEFRELFPPAVCYARIVPADEVITLNVFYREDDRLRKLLLDDADAAQLDRLWDELRFVAQEPFLLQDAIEQLVQFATQDDGQNKQGNPFAGLEPVIAARAEAFATRLVAVEPAQVEAVVQLAARAWRRPLAAAEADGLRALYRELRSDGLEHDAAVRLLLARVLVAPAFLYKLETPGPGREPQSVTGRELATRLSYFLWSSLPDEPLASAAERLQETEVLLAETRRMLRDPRARRLAVEFGTHWLHVYGFDTHDEKSPEVFPEFADLRGAMHEEAVRLLADLFQNDRSIRSLIDADHTFLNEPLAKHYGIPDVTGPEWRLVEGVREHGRGGILTLAATLSKQSGASRTSPILRGTFFTEMLLGEKLPKPPKNVPPLAESPPEGLSERELTALHSSNAACAGCHKRFDGYGFALEEYDAIGRRRDKDSAGKPIDAATALPDGTQVGGAADLRAYLASARADAFERQFLRKLLGFALGRSVQLADEPLLDEIQATLAANGHRATLAVEAIVQSPQFRQIRGLEAGTEQE